jgi:hypothetical protein
MADTIEQRALAAIIRHEKARQAVDALSMRIGSEIGNCPDTQKAMDIESGAKESAKWWDAKGRIKNHLWAAYHEQDDFGEALDTEEQEEYLTGEYGCPHCHRAWLLINQRKACRQELGRAKRQIRALGRSALRTGE